jgi:hypothetical protein
MEEDLNIIMKGNLSVGYTAIWFQLTKRMYWCQVHARNVNVCTCYTYQLVGPNAKIIRMETKIPGNTIKMDSEKWEWRTKKRPQALFYWKYRRVHRLCFIGNIKPIGGDLQWRKGKPKRTPIWFQLAPNITCTSFPCSVPACWFSLSFCFRHES